MLAVGWKDRAVYDDSHGGMRWRLGSDGEAQLMFLPEDLAELEGDGLVYLPDLSDPATLGCLLALVREAWDDQSVGTSYTRHEGWEATAPNGVEEWPRGDTEAEALVAALESAP